MRRAGKYYSKDKLPRRRGAVHSIGGLCSGRTAISAFNSPLSAMQKSLLRSTPIWNGREVNHDQQASYAINSKPYRTAKIHAGDDRKREGKSKRKRTAPPVTPTSEQDG